SMTLNQETFPEFRKKMNQGQKTLTDDKRIALAKKFLSDSLWFGVLESFDDAMRLLSYKMAWPPLGQSQKLNINKIKPVISDEARSLALSQNTLDTALYDFAVDSFNRQLEQMKSDLGVQAEDDGEAIDDLIDQHYQQNYVDRYKLQLQSEVAYDFSEILLGSQWHRREWNPISKTYFRWSGPGENSFLDFWMQPNHYNITVNIVDAVKPEFLKEIKVTINNSEVDIVNKGQGKSRQLVFECHRSLIKNNGLLRLGFNYQGNDSHKVYFSSDDNRRVGFALSSVSIQKK
ncbi:MAG: hypothetical protein ACSHWU_10935, partial [Marinicella sp.]